MTVSRQRRWQLRRIAAGLCAICSEPAVNATYCDRHRLLRNRLQNERRWNRVAGNGQQRGGFPATTPERAGGRRTRAE